MLDTFPVLLDSHLVSPEYVWSSVKIICLWQRLVENLIIFCGILVLGR